MSVCLSLLFNHAFPQQLPFHRRVYGERFPNLRFIHPMRRVPDEDVITVYRGCYSYPAYITEACERLLDLDCSHYLFVHDDVLLSPAVNADNLLKVLGVQGPDEGFIPQVIPPPRNIGDWSFLPGTVWRWFYPRNLVSGTGTDNIEAGVAALPPVEFALERMRRYGIEGLPRFKLTADSFERWNPYHHIWTDEPTHQAFSQMLLNGLYGQDGTYDEIVAPYPLAFAPAFADFTLVPRTALREVAHVAGVLAASGVAHELILPTAMVLGVETLRMSHDVGVEFEWEDHNLDADAVLDRMALYPSLVAAHPLKLSRVADLDALEKRLGDAAAIDIAARQPHATVKALAPEFDPEAYSAANPDIAVHMAYYHYRRHGHAEGRALRPSQASGA